MWNFDWNVQTQDKVKIVSESIGEMNTTGILLPTNQSELSEIISKADDYALMHGLGLRSDDESAEDDNKVWFIQNSFECVEGAIKDPLLIGSYHSQ